MENQTPPISVSIIDPLDKQLTVSSSELRSYVLRNGRLTDQQKATLQAQYRQYGIDYSPGLILGPERLFGRSGKFVIEIGFGMGTATAEIAAKLPEILFLGLEVHVPGIARLLSLIEDKQLGNLKLCRHDAIELIQTMTLPDSVDGFHIFFPDPWPKKRHHKRRLIRPSVLSLLADRLKPGAYIYFVTDWEEYAEAALETFLQEKQLQNTGSPWAERRSWRPVTKFEKRALDEGRHIREILFTKKIE